VNTVVSLASIVVYPIISGPVAALVFVQVLRRGKRWTILAFWPVLVILNALGFVFLAVTLGDFLAGPGFFSCLITPIFAVATALLLRLSARRYAEVLAEDTWHKGWLAVGTVVIPLLQLTTIVALALLAPWLCGIGLRQCSDW